MTDLRGRRLADLVAGLNAGQHLAVDAVVAFVDGELDPAAHQRAAAHLGSCRLCSAEVTAQRQARSVVRSAGCPAVPAGLLAALRDIPQTADVPHPPDGLAVTAQGTVVALAEPGRAPGASAPLGSTPPLGSGPRWGGGSATLGRWIGRSGAGVVVSGLMLGALAMTVSDEPVTGASGAPAADSTPTSVFAASPAQPVFPAAAPMAASLHGEAPLPAPVRPALAPVADSVSGLHADALLVQLSSQPGWRAFRLAR